MKNTVFYISENKKGYPKTIRIALPALNIYGFSTINIPSI